VDKTGRTSVERNEVLEEMGSYFLELAKENTMVMEDKDSIISDLRDEEVEDSTYIEIGKIIDKFKKHNAPGTDGITTELIEGTGPTLWNRIHKSITQVWGAGKLTDWRAHLIFPVHNKGSKDKFENHSGISSSTNIQNIFKCFIL
jgi:hypothetical protein